MSKKSVRILTVLSGVVLWLAGAAQAQYAPHYLKVSVPFEFSVNNKLFPAGDYVLACRPSQIELRDLQAHVLASVIPHSVQSLSDLTTPRLVFVTDTGEHVLRQVWIGDPHQGYELALSRPADALAKRRSNAPVQAVGGGNK
jgi:hypothetical protein